MIYFLFPVAGNPTIVRLGLWKSPFRAVKQVITGVGVHQGAPSPLAPLSMHLRLSQEGCSDATDDAGVRSHAQRP